eukprot:XP_011428685.1 PREDICTED: uncharacterized protein LOC105329198 [Crassostrea gigas]
MAAEGLIKYVTLILGVFTLYVSAKNQGDCRDGYGNLVKNATSYNPYVIDKTDPCVECTCLNGAITCAKRPEEECEKPKNLCGKKKGGSRKRKKRKRKRKTKKTARKGRTRRRGKTKGKRRRKNRRKERKRSMKCRSVKVSNNVTMSDRLCPAIPALSLPPDGALSCHYNNLCLPRGTEYIVYRKQISHGKHTDDNTLIIAFDHLKTEMVEIWTYLINKEKIKERQVLAKCPSPSLRAQLKTPDAILGAASSKSVKDFQRKLRRGLKDCEKKKKGCRLRTVRKHLVCFELEEIPKTKLLRNCKS